MAAAAPAATVPPSTDAAVDQGAGVNRVTAASARTTAARSSTSRVVHSPGSSTRRDNPTRVEPAAMARTSGASVRTEATSAAYTAATSSGQPSKPFQNVGPGLRLEPAAHAVRGEQHPGEHADAGDGVRRVAEPVAQQQAEADQHRDGDRLAEPVGPGRAPALHRGHQEDTGDQRALRRHAAPIRVPWAHRATPAPSATRSPPASVSADRVESWSRPNRPEA